MRFVTYSFRKMARLGLLWDEDQIIDLAEVARRYLDQGRPEY